MNIKIFCRCSLFPSWLGYGLIITPVLRALFLVSCTLNFYKYLVTKLTKFLLKDTIVL